MSLNLYLLRHGETEWSLSGQHTGRTDIPLTARGEDEARGLGERLQNITFTRVLTSPLQRASRTCALAHVEPLEPQAEIEPDLAEWDYGDYEGKRSADIHIGRPDWNLFRDGAPRGEAPGHVSERADRLLNRLRGLDGEIALFTHGHFGRVLAVRWIGLPVSEGRHFQLGTASISILSRDPHHPGVPVIERWNATPEPSREPKTPPAIQRWENEGGEIPNP